jgi:hypothetical protein
VPSSDFVSLKVDGLKEYLDALSPKNGKRAMRSAIKRITDMSRTEASTTIRGEYDIQKRDLDPFMKVRLEQYKSEITVTGRPISLLYFNARQLTAQNRVITRTSGRQLKRASRTLQQGTTYQILKGHRKNLPNAFIAYDPRTKRMVVWQRKGKERDSVRSINMVTIASLFSNKKTMAAIQTKITDNWPRVVRHELTRVMKGHGL